MHAKRLRDVSTSGSSETLGKSEECREERRHQIAAASDWGLNPLFWCHVTMLIAQVHGLRQDKESQCEHVLCGMHSISRAEIMGIITSIDIRENLVKYLVDDGTGVIACVEWKTNTPGINKLRLKTQRQIEITFKLGQRVHVLGKLKLMLSEYSEGSSADMKRELIITTILPVNDPNEEILHWARAKLLMETMYSKPAHSAFAKSWKLHFATDGNEAVSEIAERTETLLGGLLLKHLEQHETSSTDEIFFRLRDFVELENLWKETQRRTGLRPTEARKFLGGALERLVNSGKIFHIMDLYGLVSQDRVLIPAIVLTLAKFDSEKGLRMHALLKTLHADERCKNVSQEAIDSALTRLKDIGDVYEPRHRSFRLRKNL